MTGISSPAGKPVCFTMSVKIKELSAQLFLLRNQDPHPPYAFHVVSCHDGINIAVSRAVCLKLLASQWRTANTAACNKRL